jgi:hypothetical protein
MTGGEDGLYVYALAESGLPPKVRVRGHSLRVIPVSGVDVIVEPCRGAPRASSQTLHDQHELVLQLADRVPALLPVRFGALMSERSLRSFVGGHAAPIAAALARVRGHRQMTVRVFGSVDAGPEAATTPRTGTEFLTQRRARARYAPPEVAVIRRTLNDLISEERFESGPQGVRVAVYHLVRVDLVQAYSERASDLQSLLAPHRVTVSGPWPAFAFAPELP